MTDSDDARPAPTPLWRRAEITLRRRAAGDIDPDLVEVAATFVGPGGEVVRQPGFWDGGDTWRVRFAPSAPGRWTWTTSAGDGADPGLHGVRGTIEAVEDDSPHPLYRHGFVRVSDSGRAFSYADGTPFLWLGDTHWQAPNYERLHECNDPYDESCTSQFRCTVDRVVEQGFTVYQTYPDAALTDGGGNVSPVDWWSTRYDRLDPEAFRSQFDPMMDHLADRGLVIALGMGVHWANGRIGAEAMTRFARYVTARYAAHPVVWITGQEVDVENGLGTLPVWRAVAETIAATDGHRHPLGAHMDSVGEPTAFGDAPWHEWYPTQGGHQRQRGPDHYRHYWDLSPTKPFLETEANYEGIFGIGTDEMRRSAWTALQCGSYGYSYGSAGVWAMKWDHATPGWDEYQDGIPWFEGIRLPGRAQLGILKDFYLGLDSWQEHVPRFDDPAFGRVDDPARAVISSRGDRSYVVYLCAGPAVAGELRGLDDGRRYRAAWFDPRTGERTEIPDPAAPVGGTWPVPAPPDERDWVLHLAADG